MIKLDTEQKVKDLIDSCFDEALKFCRQNVKDFQGYHASLLKVEFEHILYERLNK